MQYKMTRHLLSRPTVCQLYIYACCLLYSSAPVFSSDVNKRFRARSSTSLSLLPIGTYNATSVSACAVRCVSRHNSHYFAFDQETNLCQCALTIVQGTVSPLLPSERLWDQVSDERCNMSAGFAMAALHNQQLCLKVIFSEQVNFATARARCEAFDNGRLFVSDTVDKLNLLRQIHDAVMKGSRFNLYVGMNDIVTEDEFYWEDGRLVTEEERRLLFNPGQPSNSGNEDCVMFASRIHRLNDVPCYFKSGYVCEIHA
ncbi:C-type lectin domain family 4 member M-like [Aplysia californica]|uniref:C-type lectin domain family 4 member M-like n=1 Tax=Aplysia californica TaxID=6500 RepID=A0ABM1W4N0_APLCA|nr:C-type lectin domain family 4 member M-like [Aplysia californica]